MNRIVKRAADAFWVDLDFATWPLAVGETVVASNARGAVGVTATDSAGADVSATMIEGVEASGTKVKFLIKGGAAGNYVLDVAAPTSDGEMLTGAMVARVI